MTNNVTTVDHDTLEKNLEDMVNDPNFMIDKEKYLNAPADLDSAITRIMEVEMRLEDLARACEIAEFSNNYQMLRGFREIAEESLVNKITIDRPIPEEKMKITIITNQET